MSSRRRPVRHGTIGQHGGSLTAATRTQALERLATEPYDVIVVGAGVTGAGAALDAASRGLRAALVERVDLAAGTSRWSSKLVHGGLRYLAKADLAIAYESAVERHHLMTAIAPHLVRPLANIVPDEGPARGALSSAGIMMADGLRRAARTSSAVLPPPRRVSPDEINAAVPAARPGLHGIRYADGQLVDDARLVTALARTAAVYGADVVTRCAARPFDADRIELTDELTGATLTARGHIVMATGVWSGEFEPDITVTPSRGTHLVLRADRLGFPSAQLSAPVPGHFGRFIFTIPIEDDLVLLGLTDEAAPGVDGIAPPVPQADEEFLLATMSGVLRTPLTPADVVGRFAGLRPLVSRGHVRGGGAGATRGPATADASRKHLLIDVPGRPLTITGGKLTTYRAMAQDVIDAVLPRLDAPLRAAAGPCVTRTLPLLGAAPRPVLDRVAAPARLIRRYGTLAADLQALIDADPTLGEPVAPGSATVRAEFAYAIANELALAPEDLVERRTRVSFVAADVPEATRTAAGMLEAASAPA